MSPTLEMTPRWEAVGWVVTHNMRDVADGRYALASELVAWFKSLAMFRETERELMILRQPAPEDLDFHKTVLALVIAEGERLRAMMGDASTPGRDEGTIKREDFVAALAHLYDTQSVWHGEMTGERRTEILEDVFHGQIAGT